VSGEFLPERPLDRDPGRRQETAIRQPGDLPSAVVTRDDIGRGVPMEAEPFAPPGMTVRASSR